MDIIDASDYDFLLPWRIRKLIALALMIGVAFAPPVKRWYLDQVERHSQHVIQEFISIVTPDDANPGPLGVDRRPSGTALSSPLARGATAPWRRLAAQLDSHSTERRSIGPDDRCPLPV